LKKKFSRKTPSQMKRKQNPGQIPSKSASLLVYEEIKKKILQNELDSKKPLDEKIFSKEFSTSRTPIREALIMLEREGLITRQDGKGFAVKQFSMKDIQDLYQFREINETGMAAVILSKLSPQKLEGFCAILDEIQPLIQKGTPGEILEKSFAFHIKFIELCENAAMIEAMRNCHEKILRVAWSCKEEATSYQDYQEHRKILAALKKGDLEKLQITIRQHIHMARDNALNILKNNIEKLYFLP
jgi:DNA-binding GntR family transcriptional regulator